jgi:hypothetical protein
MYATELKIHPTKLDNCLLNEIKPCPFSFIEDQIRIPPVPSQRKKPDS